MNKKMFLGIAVLSIFFMPVQAEAHSLFNSAEEFIGGYRVQIATLPEFPQIDENSQILLRITDADFEEIDGFTLGLRIDHAGQQINTWEPTFYSGSHWESIYVFKTTGNHIVYVDLYDMREDGQVITYTFNISTQSPFGYIFIISITMGAIMLTIVVGIVYLPKHAPNFMRRS
ncbi:MAG: putative membrane protein [Cenarchaeum symbiont of Oopsacas minuta]|nr:putative membrane protein [Cenarchaeum symbiont of Oopsacas minuta]